MLLAGLLPRDESRLRWKLSGLERPWTTQDELLAELGDRIGRLVSIKEAQAQRKSRVKPLPKITRPRKIMLRTETDRMEALEAQKDRIAYLRQFAPGGRGEGSSDNPRAAAMEAYEIRHDSGVERVNETTDPRAAKARGWELPPK